MSQEGRYGRVILDSEDDRRRKRQQEEASSFEKDLQKSLRDSLQDDHVEAQRKSLEQPKRQSYRERMQAGQEEKSGKARHEQKAEQTGIFKKHRNRKEMKSSGKKTTVEKQEQEAKQTAAGKQEIDRNQKLTVGKQEIDRKQAATAKQIYLERQQTTVKRKSELELKQILENQKIDKKNQDVDQNEEQVSIASLSPKDNVGRLKEMFSREVPWKAKAKKALFVLMMFVIMYCIGELTAMAVDAITGIGRSAETSAVVASKDNWGLGFGQEGQQPSGNASAEELKQYDTYFCGSADEKVIYLTFDCGYENGNTEKILDALKKHNAIGTFFVVGNYLETSPDIVKRMVDEGHIVGNHTYHHYDMSKISTTESFTKEIQDVENLFEQITGKQMTKFYRPPQGKYNTENLKMAQQLGYKTFFWSLAYVDWYQDKQPTKEEAYSKLLTRIHPGAVVLLHNTSSTNGEIIDELLTKWEEMGYTFRPLTDLCEQPAEE